jgi:hypothetical protein
MKVSEIDDSGLKSGVVDTSRPTSFLNPFFKTDNSFYGVELICNKKFVNCDRRDPRRIFRFLV